MIDRIHTGAEMAKLLVLLAGADEGSLDVAGWVHEGALSVRFAESDIMRLPGSAVSARMARVRTLDDFATVATYDAVALGAAPADADQLHKALESASGIGLRGELANKLGAVFPAPADPMGAGERNPLWGLLAPMARYGMILVPPGYGGPDGEIETLEAAARRLGRRLIDIAAWITHARSHHHH
jgi:hypothetical protein